MRRARGFVALGVLVMFAEVFVLAPGSAQADAANLGRETASIAPTGPEPTAPGSQPSPQASPSPSPQANAKPLLVRAQFLALANGYLIFTTGDAVAVDPALRVPAGLRLGVQIRATLDPVSREVVRIEIDPRADPADIDAAKIPREYVVADPKSARTGAVASSSDSVAPKSVTITITVRVPGSTPVGDTIYVSTDRSSFNPSEITMVRVDASRWSAKLELPAGTSLRYDFSRGSFSNLERDRIGGVVIPRSLVAVDGEKTDDVVASWADSQ